MRLGGLTVLVWSIAACGGGGGNGSHDAGVVDGSEAHDASGAGADAGVGRPNFAKLGFDGPVRATLHVGSSWYIGGDFDSVHALASPYAAALSGSGVPVATCDLSGFDNHVRATTAVGTAVYVGGDFKHYRGASALHLAKLDATTCALDTTFSPAAANGFDGAVYAITASATALYVGGTFSAYRGVAGSSGSIAKLDLTTGALDTAFSPAGSANNGFVVTPSTGVSAIALAGTSVYVAGYFSSYRGGTATPRNIAKLDQTDGTLDAAFTPAGTGFDQTVQTLAVSGTSLYVGGSFAEYRGSDAGCIAKVDLTTGVLDTMFTHTTGFNDTVDVVAVHDGSVYVGGAFYRYDSAYVGEVAKLDASTGALDASFNASDVAATDGPVEVVVNTLVVSGTSLYVGGMFADAGAHFVDNIMKADAATGVLDTTFAPYDRNGFDGEVYAISLVGSNLWVGGTFTTYGGDYLGHLGKFDDSTFALDRTFSPSGIGSNGFDDLVTVLATAGTSLYVGGVIGADNRSGVEVDHLAKLDLTTGALDTTFNAGSGFDGNTFALAVVGNSLYVGGYFQRYHGLIANMIAKVDATTGALDTAFSSQTTDNGFDNAIFYIAASGSNVYVGGQFSTYRGIAGNAHDLVKIDATTGNLDTTFSPPTNNGFDAPVRTLALAGNALYVGGDFAEYRGEVSSAGHLAKLDATDGTLDTAFATYGAGNGFDHAVNALAVTGSALYAGGVFTSYASTPNSAPYLCRLDATTGALDTAFHSPLSGEIDTLAGYGSDVFAAGQSISDNYVSRVDATTGAKN